MAAVVRLNQIIFFIFRDNEEPDFMQLSVTLVRVSNLQQ